MKSEIENGKSEMGHTPGPWYSETVNSTGDCAVRSKNDPNPTLYCTVSVGWGPKAIEICAANARLIAAAPDLLQELQNIADAKPQNWEPEIRDQFQAWAQSRARAAITKATTGQNDKAVAAAGLPPADG